MDKMRPQVDPKTTPANVDEVHVDRLREAGLRPTKQRLILMNAMFGNGDRHFTAEELFREVGGAGASMVLATVYNTLNVLADHGVLRRVSVDGQRSWFDTNIKPHHHFYVDDDQQLIDIDSTKLKVVGMPELPEGRALEQVDVIIRIR
jgi:Fe2+/Zn2+ uptake regulation proteins